MAGDRQGRAGPDRRLPGKDVKLLLAAARRGKLWQIHLEDRHVEGVGHLAVFLILEDDADELTADMHFDGVGLRPLEQRNRVEPEQVAQIFFDAPDFAAGQRLTPSLTLLNSHGRSARSSQARKT